MDKDKFKAKQQWAGEVKPSMKRRRVGHDYQSRCIYMITLTVKARRPLLGHITGDGATQPALMHLCPMGQAVSDAVPKITHHCPAIEILAHQVMPDHVHIIIFVHERIPQHLSHVISGFKGGCNILCRELGLDTTTLWEEGFNDRILDHNVKLQNLINYVHNNPQRYAIKRANPDLFRVKRNVQVGCYTFAALGNIFLLDAPLLLQVQCSRSITDNEIAYRTDQYLQQCENGAVLVSPRISHGEKQIMNAAFERGFPTIILRENGFSQYSKPGGKYFDACAQGRLLLLTPWEHHNRDITPTRDQFLALNHMAQTICNRPSR